MAKKGVRKNWREKPGRTIRAFQLTKEFLLVLETLVQADETFPLGLPANNIARNSWVEYGMGWFIAAALRKEISQNQVDECLSPIDVFRLWLAFTKATANENGYSFSSNDKKTRRVVTPDDFELRGKAVFGKI